MQRTFTKRLRGYQDLSYDERLKRLNLDTLELWKTKSDLQNNLQYFCHCRSKYTRLFLTWPLLVQGDIHSNFTNILAVAQFDHPSLVKELLTLGIGSL